MLEELDAVPVEEEEELEKLEQLEESRLDLLAWRSPHHVPSKAISARYSALALPPSCPPKNLEASASKTTGFWNQKVVLKDHIVCEYSDGCTRRVSNLEKLSKIRGALAATKKLLDEKNLTYMLYGGSAVGQYRCGDVLPWDVDCDVAVNREQVKLLEPLANQEELPTSSGFVLQKKSHSIPFAVVDKSSGFYCDIFGLDFEPGGKTVAIPWPWGQQECPKHTESKGKCLRYPKELVYPFQPCELNGVQFQCAHDRSGWLRAHFGPAWEEPDVEIQA